MSISIKVDKDGYPKVDIDRVAREVLNKLIEDKCNIDFIKSEINKKFSEDIRLTMVGVMEDEGLDAMVINCAQSVYTRIINYISSDEFIRNFISSLTYYFRSSSDSDIDGFIRELSRLLLNKTEMGNLLEGNRSRLDILEGQVMEMKYSNSK